MKILIKLLLGWGVLDSAFLAASPQTWAHFWTRGVGVIGGDKRIARTVSALQLALCVYLLRKL